MPMGIIHDTIGGIHHITSPKDDSHLQVLCSREEGTHPGTDWRGERSYDICPG
jgi:hypothetical protein